MIRAGWRAWCARVVLTLVLGPAGVADLHAEADPSCLLSPSDPSADRPDDGYVDVNGDGIDGMRCGPIFVSPTGSDANLGTIEAPMRTLGAAILAAHTHGRDVYIAKGVYEGTVVLASGVNLYGGFDDDAGWARSLASRATIHLGPGGGDVAALAVSIDQRTVVDHIVVESNRDPGAVTPGSANAAVLVVESAAAVAFRNCDLHAARGTNGAQGASGALGENGGNGHDGGCGTAWPAPVTIGSCAGGGGPGGYQGGSGGGGGGNTTGGGGGGLPWCPPSCTDVTPAPGHGGWNGAGPLGGVGGSNAGLGGPGGPGGPGLAGSPGSGGPGFGLDGSAGTNGESGSGGGGGGGGTGGIGLCLGGQICLFSSGGGGGGGGGGGVGGAGGAGGGGAGSAYGVVARNGLVELAGCRLSIADGGNGGNGGPGGAGGAGGAGGIGSSLASGIVGTPGGPGGPGGSSGAGGPGGGGSGGNSIGILRLAGGSSSIDPSTIITTGTPGLGGPGLGHPGAVGIAADVHDLAFDSIPIRPTCTPCCPPAATHARLVLASGASQTTATIELAAEAGLEPAAAVTIVASPAHGSASLQGNAVTYAPEAGFTGIDGFEYQACRDCGGCANGFAVVFVPTAVTEVGEPAPPVAIALGANRPNPFQEATRIPFSLDREQRVRLVVLDVGGREVVSMMDRRLGPGSHALEWDGRDAGGRAVESGVYYLRLTAGSRTLTRRAVLLR
jgi:Big-like domain-containing protein/flagellar hook capping protein FlgD